MRNEAAAKVKHDLAQLAAARRSHDDDDDDSLFREWLQADDPEEASLEGLKEYDRAHKLQYERYMRWKATATHEEVTAQKALFRNRIEMMLNMGASKS